MPACLPACPRPLSLSAPQLTHNSYHLSFELPGGASANMPVASCLLTKALLQGPGDDKPKVVVRPYTPVSKPDAAGHLDLVIKAYPAGVAWMASACVCIDRQGVCVRACVRVRVRVRASEARCWPMGRLLLCMQQAVRAPTTSLPL